MPPFIDPNDFEDGVGSSDEDVHGSTIATVAPKPVTAIHTRKRPVTLRTKHTYISIVGAGSERVKWRFKAEYGGIKRDKRYPCLTDALVAKFCYAMLVQKHRGTRKLDSRGELRKINEKVDILEKQNAELLKMSIGQLKILQHIRYILGDS